MQRTKEVGIRKVLGASVNSTLKLLYKDFAFVISAPIGWYAIHQWLQTYAFRMDINPLLFVIPFFSGIAGSFCNGIIPKRKSSADEPGKEFENGVVNKKDVIASNHQGSPEKK